MGNMHIEGSLVYLAPCFCCSPKLEFSLVEGLSSRTLWAQGVGEGGQEVGEEETESLPMN